MLDAPHTVRLAILTALHEVEALGPRPMTVQDLEQSLTIRTSGVTLSEIRRELPGLVDHGYIRDLTPTRGRLVRLTAKGRDQVTRDAELDEYIYGPDAFIGR